MNTLKIICKYVEQSETDLKNTKKRRMPITTKIAKEIRRVRKAADSHQKYPEDHSKISEIL